MKSVQTSGSPADEPHETSDQADCGCARPAEQATDAALVAACLRGESAGWEALVRRYQRLVYAVVRRMGMDEHTGADVFQTVFSRLLTHLPRIADPSRLQAWIVTTAKREALLLRQRAERNVSIDIETEDGVRAWDPPDSVPLTEDVLDELQQQHRVRQALDELDDRCRKLIELLFNRDDDTALAYDLVARSLNMAVGSIGPTRARCLAKLRRLLE